MHLLSHEAAYSDAGSGTGRNYPEENGTSRGRYSGAGPWRAFLERRHKAETTEPVHIALVGKYDLQDAYKSIREALSQAGTYNDRKVSVDFVNSEKLTDENVAEALKGMSGVLIGPGFGERGIAGKFVAIKYARTHDIPTFGICLGMQCIAIEFARNVLGYADANSREMDEKTPHNVIDIMEEQKSITNMGGTMRLGAYECVLQEGSKATRPMARNTYRSATVTAMSSTTHIRQSMKRPACSVRASIRNRTWWR